MKTTPTPLEAHFRDDLPRWQQLVRPLWLHELTQGQEVVAAPKSNWRLIEVGCGASDLFLQGHIPNATYLDTQDLEQAPFWNKVTDEALLQHLLNLGIAYDTTVILYGRLATAAARAAHLMLYAGVRDVRLLDGGLTAWLHAGLPLARGPAHRHARATHFGAEFPACPHFLIHTPQVKALLLQANSSLVSIRSHDEFMGNTSGYSYIDAKGDIPGARWGRAGDGRDVNNMSAFQQADGRMRPAQEIERFWCEASIDASHETAFYCGTGWRASLAFFYAWLMGWERISVYDGGWYEWSSDLQNPRLLRCHVVVGQNGPHESTPKTANPD